VNGLVDKLDLRPWHSAASRTTSTHQPPPPSPELTNLIKEGRVKIHRLVRQELLSPAIKTSSSNENSVSPRSFPG